MVEVVMVKQAPFSDEDVPEWVANAWVGIVLPLAILIPDVGEIEILGCSVEAWEMLKTFPCKGPWLIVEIGSALKRLEQKNSQAAAWWREKLKEKGLTEESSFFFDAEACLLVSKEE